MKLAEAYRKISALAGLLDDGRHREEILDLGRDLTSQEDASSLLWLYDEEKCKLHLDHYEPFVRHGGLPEFAGVSIDCNREQFNNIDVVKQLCKDDGRAYNSTLGTGNTYYRKFFQVNPLRGYCGLLEIISIKELSEEATILLDQLAEIVASRITRHRDVRRLSVLSELTTRNIPHEEFNRDLLNNANTSTLLDSELTPDQWLSLATSTVRQNTSAELCITFRQSSDLSLEAVSYSSHAEDLDECFRASKESLIRYVFDSKKNYRVLNHSDLDERISLFGSSSCDVQLEKKIEELLSNPLRSWMAATVSCDGFPVAVIFVANKPADKYLPAVFSQTDFRLLHSVCDTLSRAYARSQVTTASREISSLVFNLTDDEISNDDKAKLLTAVKRHVPGIEGCCVSLRSTANEEPYEIIDIAMENQTYSEDLARLASSDRVEDTTAWSSKIIDIEDQNFYLIEQRIPLVDGPHVAVIHFLSRRAELAPFESMIIEHLTFEISHLVRTKLKLREEMENIIQIRHAIRSGLQGVRHLDNAWEIYQQIAKKGMQPSDFRVAMLRKSLQWSILFAERTRTLVEESRYLLGKITTEQLRLGGITVSNMVKEIIRCLKIDAEDREIQIVFSNKIYPTFDKATADHMLIYITIFNILDNAVKYSHRNQVIHVELDGSHARWNLAVQDRGVYIQKHDLEAIFQPLIRRPTGSNNSNRPGTGLGLAVVKQVMNAHGGLVSVTSRLVDNSNVTGAADTQFKLSVPRHPNAADINKD